MIQEAFDTAIPRLVSRDFDTIRNAIANGINWGSFSVNQRDQISTFEWRLLGDVVEVKKEESKYWNILNVDDMDFLFSGGVYGKRKDLHLGFLCYDDASNEV